MDKGRLMEILGLKHMVDSAIPIDWSRSVRALHVSRPEFWYVWSYLKDGTYHKPVHLGEKFFNLLQDTPVTVNGDSQVTILDLIETLLAHPEEVTITIK